MIGQFLKGKKKGTVVTNERLKDNAAGLPNVCEKFEIPCLDLEEFMKREYWIFYPGIFLGFLTKISPGTFYLTAFCLITQNPFKIEQGQGAV
jgi:hypothetical protein